MISIKTDKITAMWILIAITISVGYTTFPGIIAERREASVSLAVSQSPKVGEVFRVSFTFTLKVPPESANTYPHKVRFNINTFPEKGAYEIVNGQLENKLPQLSEGIPVTFNISAIITKPVIRLQIIGSIPGRGAWGKSREFYLLDSVTGQYGTKEQWLNKGIGVLGKYNNVEPQWFSEIDPSWAESNRKIVQEMRQFEPALTDSEALCLHQDNYLLIINAIGDSNATDEQRIEHLLEAGWLDAQRSGAEAKEDWLKDLIEKYKGKPLTKE